VHLAVDAVQEIRELAERKQRDSEARRKKTRLFV